MYRLNRKDIAFIKQDLQRRGLVYDPLRDELTDHVCSEVEELLAKGWEFKKAYDHVLRDVQPSEIIELQDSTYQSDFSRTSMIAANHFKIMFRNMAKHKSYALLTIGGLAIGLACFILIGLYVKHELTFDRQFSNYPSLYRITMSSNVGGKTNHIPTAMPTLGPLLQANTPEVKQYARIINYKYTRLTPTFSHDDKVFYEDRVLFVDSSFFQLFDFEFAQGNPTTALQGANSVVITEGIAKKYFGDEPALGKVLHFNNKADLEITGIVKDMPSNVHLQFDFVIPMAGLVHSGVFSKLSILDTWQIDWFWTYLLIPQSNEVAQVEKRLNDLAKDHTQDFADAKFYLQPVADVHLHSHFDYGTDITPNSDLTNLFIFISVGVLILLISSINFINLSLAASARRTNEIGINKVLGAMKSQLRTQFLVEAMLTSLLAFAVAAFLVQVALPFFGPLLGVELSASWLNNPWEIGAAFAFAIFIGAFSGLYPAFFLSSFEPQRVLKGVWKSGQGGAQFRTALVGLQIVISLFLVVGTAVVLNQLNYIRSKDLGYSKDQIIMLTVRGTSIPRSYHAFKHKLESHNSVVKVSSVSEPVGREVQFMSFKVEGQATDQFVKILNVGYDFVETMGLELKAGRDFSRGIISDSVSGFIINEAAARHYGWTDPIGKGIRHGFGDAAPQGAVVGVVKDFNFEPMHTQIDPLIIFKGFPAWYVAVRVKPEQIQNSLAWIETAWKEFEPAKPFNYHFLDQSIERVYQKEERISNTFFVFAILSMVTVTLGLFGLVAFMAEQRLSEIGVRKVLGASVASILSLFAKDYARVLIISFVIGTPVTWFIMQNWLQNFAFHISVSPVYFIAAGAIVAVVVVGTVVVRAWSAANSNPVDVLKSE